MNASNVNGVESAAGTENDNHEKSTVLIATRCYVNFLTCLTKTRMGT